MSGPGEPPAIGGPPDSELAEPGDGARREDEGRAAPEPRIAPREPQQGAHLSPVEDIQHVAGAQLAGAEYRGVDDAEELVSEAPPVRGRGLARNTAIFSFLTAFSRVVGLLREIIFASYFGTSGPASAYTLASQVPNFVAQLFAQSALSAAFVPVFTDLLQKGRRKEAVTLASTLFWIMLIALGALTALFILGAGVIMPLFIGSGLAPQTDLTVGLSQVMFPMVLLLGINGLLVGILQSYDHFTIPALLPAVWNVVIIVLLVTLAPHFHGDNEIYAFAIGVLVATGVQVLLSFGALGRIDFRLRVHVDWHDPRIKQVFLLMLPVTIGLGIVNLDQLINSTFGGLLSEEAPRAIDNAFRVYMLPQGIFSVSVATVLFPTLSRMASHRDAGAMRGVVGNGMRQINLMLIPAGTFMLVLATPIVRLLFERGEFNAHSTHLVSIALFWFAFSLPFGGLNLLLTRAFFAVQRPWIPTSLAAVNVVVDIIVSIGLYKPLGIAGLIIGTILANIVMFGLQFSRLRTGLGGRLEGGQTTMITARILVASAVLAAVSWLVWSVLDSLLGRSLPAEIIEVGAAGAAGAYVYARAVLVMHVPEAHQVSALLRSRFGRA